ncbi:MAG TPA: AbrB/MazE/SpoVT family DNA-binding domain-containing protein [Opitutaceae bacterium]|jgi:antitoxin VapB|nr:AbrB/MazE/SpoVT family DNA-binding domain-containing protein [Opitutaceae bacterium]
MSVAKLFKHGGSQAVRLPKAFRFSGSEVLIERRGEEVVLRSKHDAQVKSLADIAHFMAHHHPGAASFPDRVPQPPEQKRELKW